MKTSDMRTGLAIEEIKARIRWLNEMIKHLQFKTPAKETKH